MYCTYWTLSLIVHTILQHDTTYYNHRAITQRVNVALYFLAAVHVASSTTYEVADADWGRRIIIFYCRPPLWSRQQRKIIHLFLFCPIPSLIVPWLVQQMKEEDKDRCLSAVYSISIKAIKERRVFISFSLLDRGNWGVSTSPPSLWLSVGSA